VAQAKQHSLSLSLSPSSSATAATASASASASASATAAATAAATAPAYSLIALCSPAVRETALEAYLRLCFVQLTTQAEKHKRATAAAAAAAATAASATNTTTTGSSAASTSPSTAAKSTADVSALSAAAFDAVATVLKHEPNRRTRRQASISLLHAIQNRPARCAFAAFSLNEPWLCVGWADTDALTLPHPGGLASAVVAAKAGAPHLAAHPLAGKKTAAIHYRNALSHVALGQGVRVATKTLWKSLLTTACNDQVRSRIPVLFG
jgi:hypothetical protein